MNRILFDLTATQPVGGIKRHGGSKYGEIILNRILEREFPVACYYDGKRWLNPLLKSKIDGCLFDINNSQLSKIVNETGSSLIYSPLPNISLLNFGECRIIGTIHGLRRLETPADPCCFLYHNLLWKDWMIFLYKYLAPSLFKRQLCKYYLREWQNPKFSFVTVSNHTACAIRAYFPSLKNRKVPVFYSPSTSSDKELSTKYTDRYFLLVSGNRFEKNNLRAIKALDMLFQRGDLDGYKVRIAGAKAANAFRYKIKCKERFDFLGYVDDDELEQLYYDAYCLIYPSLNEGFGYPPLEAMHYGVPVLTSPFASITEVCEGASIYFNPFSVEEIATRILHICDANVHREYSERGLKQFDKITARQKADLDALIDFLYKEAEAD